MLQVSDSVQELYSIFYSTIFYTTMQLYIPIKFFKTNNFPRVESDDCAQKNSYARFKKTGTVNH